MSLVKLNEIIEGKYTEELKNPKEYKGITVDDYEDFLSLLSIDQAYFMSLGITEDSNEFYKAFDFLKKAIPEEKQEDLFYAAKLGFFFEGVPVRLTYILNKAIQQYDTPNNAISAIDGKLLSRYMKKGSLPEGLTIKKIMENLLGCSFETLLPYRRKAKWKDCYEIYVEDTDRVLIVPEDIGVLINSRDDLANIHYVRELGVCLYNEPIRTMEGRIGVTTDDYDLRGSF